MVEEKANNDLNEKQSALLEMMYNGDIDSDIGMEKLGIPIEELYKIVDELIQLEMIIASGDEEVEISENGKNYIIEKINQNSEEKSK